MDTDGMKRTLAKKRIAAEREQFFALMERYRQVARAAQVVEVKMVLAELSKVRAAMDAMLKSS
jgi:hypothetical protein